MARSGVHKRWHAKFLLKEIACRVPEHAQLSPQVLEEHQTTDLALEHKIRAFARHDPVVELQDITLPLFWHARLLLRRAEYDIYKSGAVNRERFLHACRYDVLSSLLRLGRNVAVMGHTHCWSSTLRELAETLACAYALGWNAAGDKIAECAHRVMPLGAFWSESDWDPRWEKKREPFARFTLALQADFAGVILPPLPPHPYEAPVYDALLACWRDPDPQALVEPLLAACDWHTHECMYSRSDRPSKNVDFINDTLMGWPVEVHMVYRLRERLGLGLPSELDHPLMQTPLGPYPPPQPVPRDDRLDRVIRRAFAEVPGLQAVLAGAL